MRKNKMILADLLAEVKLAEKKLEKTKSTLPVAEARIKQALIAGNRELAKKYALSYEERKLEVKRAEQHLTICKKQFAQGKIQAQSATSAKSLRRTTELTKAMNIMTDALNMATDDDEMLQKLETDAAVAEARLDLATEAALEKQPEIDIAPPTGAAPPPTISAEDILKEFE